MTNKIYQITTYRKVGSDYRTYKKEKAESKDAAYLLRRQWKTECGVAYLGSIIRCRK